MMDEIAKINIGDFKKKEDGSWVTVNNSNISTKGGNMISLPRGMTFRPGVKQFGGIDIVKALDEISQN
ncbi:MAG: hypothetical protein A4E72_01630 [Syntrophus sp. PtaU1.Bin208]|nr:MAG: hypothetical protein A4E72_01630 [Syntrophus sp. PtaU1.Bin208]